MKTKFFLITIIVVLSFVLPVDKRAIASYYNNTRIELTRLSIGVPASHTISFTLSNNEQIEFGYNIELDFLNGDAGFDINGVADLEPSDFDFNDGLDRTIVSTDGTCAAGQDNENDITIDPDYDNEIISFVPCSNNYIPSPPNASVVIRIGSNAIIGTGNLGANKILNPPTPGTYYINIGNNGTPGTNVAIAIIPDDQLSISGTVDPSITALISSQQTLGFGEVTTNRVRYATSNQLGSDIEPGNKQPITISAGTNGQGGIILYLYDKGDGVNSGLWSEALSEMIPASPSHLVIENSKLYGVYGKNSTGLTLNPFFDNNGMNGEGPITTSPQILAQNNNPFASGSLDLVLKSATNNTTKAGKYVDTITILCTAIY